MNWFSAVIEFIERFWFLEKVMHFERGVPYLFGQLLEKESWWCYGGELQPRVYVKVPWFMEIHMVPVKADILKLWNLNITTTDDVSLRFRANIRYEIFDAVKAWNEVQEYKDNLADECRTNLASAMRNMDYADLLKGQLGIEKDAKSAINKAVKEWGIRVIRVGVTDFIKTTDISLANV